MITDPFLKEVSLQEDSEFDEKEGRHASSERMSNMQHQTS